MSVADRRQSALARQEMEDRRGSGEQARDPEPRYLAVGRIVAPHGIRGELKVEILTDDPDRFGLLELVYLGREDEEPVPWELVSYRLHKNQVLLQLKGCNDRAMAETMRGIFVQVPREEAIPLKDGEYYEYQIIGLEVKTVSGELLGRVIEILYTGANDVYVVRDDDPSHREILIPVLDDIVLEIDLEAGSMVVELPEGLV